MTLAEHWPRSAVGRGLWAAFAANASARGDAPALVFSSQSVSFSELIQLAEKAAGWLVEKGLSRGDTVALQLPKRLDTYVLWLACLRQGCPYVFMDPRNPASRTDSILARVRPRLFVTESSASNPFGITLQRAGGDDNGTLIGAFLAATAKPEPANVHGLDPAYIMFTSGSTGEPKGAVIPQQGVLSLMRWARTAIADPKIARFSNINPLHFDNAVFDLFGGLVNGATLVPVETSALSNPAHWVRRLRDGGANVIFAVPTLFLTLSRLKLLKPESLPDARVLMFGGEGFPIAALAQVYEHFKSQARLVNVYGPTETSCICSSHEINETALAAAATSLPSIGRMHPDFEHAIRNEHGDLVAAGSTGELWIGGTNVGLGYYNNGKETARRFVQDPAQSNFRSIWYRTGDLVREDAAGLLWFLGRADNQVKIRGHRIELEEIDLAVEAICGVKRAMTVVIPSADGPELYVAFHAERTVPLEEVQSHCAARLPPYMRPARSLQVEVLPQNANGKVDRKAVERLVREAS
jgi:D-alanine--poly(phosphoribitol) ligase subunit 1